MGVVTPGKGQIIGVDEISFEFISVPSDYKKHENINGTSIIFLVHFPKRDVLVTGDFDVTAEEEFFEHCDLSKLRCDIVQMPHHGQNGVDRAFYELIMPKICLYTTPQWLWENNRYKRTDPETVGKGPFTTLETRAFRMNFRQVLRKRIIMKILRYLLLNGDFTTTTSFPMTPVQM